MNPITDHDLIQKCLDIAIKAHRDQPNKKGPDPYIVHPLTVSLFVATHEHPYLKPLAEALDSKQLTYAICAALLHDVVEDTKITLDDLRKTHHLPEPICHAGGLLTMNKSEDYHTQLIPNKADPIARLVKLADNLHNTDLSRLTKVTPKDMENHAKYLKSIDFLKQE